MKLWQKIFLISLAFVMLAVSVTATAVARGSFVSGIDQAKTNAFGRHEYAVSGMINKVSFERLRSSELALTEEAVLGYAEEVLASYANSGMGVALYEGGDRVGAIRAEGLNDVPELFEAVGEGRTCSIIAGSPERLIIGSPLNLEGFSFTLYTLHDVSGVYAQHARVLSFIRIMSAVFAVLSAAILLVLVRRLLRPLDRINASLAAIADGSYETRVAPEGGEEFSVLARNVNVMAEAVEENVADLTEIADRRKTFVDNFAHEMKTPLTSIICLADVMRIKKDLSEEERVEYADIIAEEAKRLKNLSGKLLELTVAGHAELEKRNIDAAEFLDEVRAALTPVAEQRGMHLAVRVPQEVRDAHVMIRGDRELLSSLLFNLTDNAFKACSGDDTVEIRCPEDEGRLEIAVIDHGVGMAKEDLRKVTEPFYMVDKSRSRKAGGAGLGLALCLEIAKQHGAKFKIASALGKGTRVTLRFPIAEGAASEADAGCADHAGKASDGTATEGGGDEEA